MKCEFLFFSLLDINAVETEEGKEPEEEEKDENIKKGRKIMDLYLSKLTSRQPTSNIIMLGKSDEDKIDFINVLHRVANKVGL